MISTRELTKCFFEFSPNELSNISGNDFDVFLALSCSRSSEEKDEQAAEKVIIVIIYAHHCS